MPNEKELEVNIWNSYCIGISGETNGTNTMLKLKSEMELALGTTASCTSNSWTTRCYVDSFYCYASYDKYVICGSNNSCEVYPNGSARCRNT